VHGEGEERFDERLPIEGSSANNSASRATPMPAARADQLNM
jgi:hypothetical protein